MSSLTLNKICEKFYKESQFDESLDELLSTVTTFFTYNKGLSSRIPHTINLIDNYKSRIQKFKSVLLKYKTDSKYNDLAEELSVICYDELANLYIMIFSIYDNIYPAIENNFRKFLFNKRLLIEKILDKELMKTQKTSTLFTSYDFPFVINILFKGLTPFKELFASSIEVDVSETEIFADSFVYLMCFRNQFGHMSEKLELFSLKNLETNFLQLSTYFIMSQQNMIRLIKICNYINSSLSD